MPFKSNSHHRKSIRLRGYDYSQAGLYFVTICCQDRECLFGNVADGQMILNDAGKMAYECWQAIPDHFPNTVLHEWIVMPNHVHGIIELKTENANDAAAAGAQNANDIVPVGAENFLPLQHQHIQQTQIQPQRNKFQKMIPRSIGSIVKGFKIGVTKWFRSNTEIQSVWQRNYYEHIIRNEKSYTTISDYIVNNPSKWVNDQFYEE